MSNYVDFLENCAIFGVTTGGGTPGGGTVTSVGSGTGLTGGPITGAGTLSIANTAVTAGSYTAANITVNAQGQITAAANGGAGTLVVDGDTGSISGNPLKIWANKAALGSGSTVFFDNSSAISLLQLSDSINGNTILGNLSGNLTMSSAGITSIGTSNFNALTSGINSVALGNNNLSSLQNGNYHCAVGANGVLFNLTSGESNSAFGYNAGANLLTGNNCLLLGKSAGNALISDESNNIYLQSQGIAAESNCLRIGSGTGSGAFELSTVFISGINGNSASSPKMVVINSLTDQLGTQDIPSSSVITTTFVNTNFYDVLITDDVILVDSLAIGSPSTINLISFLTPPMEDHIWTIKDWSGDCQSHNIIIDITDGGNIDGSSSFTLNKNNQAVSILWSVTEQTYSIVYDYTLPFDASISISGDTGSITGNNFTIYADQAALNCGSTVNFSNSSTTSLLSVTDVNNNTIIGFESGNLTVGSLNGCTALGLGILNNATNAILCIGIGNTCLSRLETSEGTIAIGSNAGNRLLTGNYSIYLGLNAGYQNVSDESNNVYINSTGSTAESNCLRLGEGTGNGQQQLSTAFISGINSNTLGGTPLMVVIDSSTDQLGVLPVPGSGQIPWTNETASSFDAAVNNGYFCDPSGAQTVNLPPSPSQGDIIDIYVDSAFPITIQMNTGQFLRLGAAISTSAGQAANTSLGDSLTLVYRAVFSTWLVISAVGEWNLS